MTATAAPPRNRRAKPAAPALPPSYGGAVCRWIEENLVHAEGDFLGDPFILDPVQKQVIWGIYSYDPQTMKRIVRRVLVVQPKGTGKTELFAAIALAEFAGPTWLNPRTGRPERRRSPNIPVAASSWEQADRLFGAARVMAEQGRLAPFVETYETEMLLKGDVGRMFRVAAVGGTNDGGLPTTALFDEIHELKGRRERVHLVICNSLAKRADGLELNITTPDDADPESLLGRLVAYGEKIVAGEIDDPTFMYVRHSAPTHWEDGSEVDINDPEQLRAALRICHPFSWVDVDRVAARYEIDRIPEHEFRRYHLAQFVRSSEKWLPAGAWEQLSTAPAFGEVAPLPADGTEIVIGFDGSYNNDSTALIGVTVGEEPHVFTYRVWEKPEQAHDDWVVPRDEVDEAVHLAFKRWKVRQLICDPPGWHQEIEAWARAYGGGKDDDGVVIAFDTNQRARMAELCSRFYTAVVTGKLSHDGNPVLTRHLHNAVVRETTDGAYITKDGRNSPRKIDAAIAAVVAYGRATRVKARPFLAVW